MSGHWPPNGEDSGDDEFSEQADQPGAEDASRLSAVSAFLAAVPAPVMPDTVEARISAALAAESATRAAVRPQADGTRADPTRATEGPLADRPVLPQRLHHPKRRTPLRRFQGAGRRILVTGPAVLVVCLALVGFGFLLSSTGSSDSGSAASSGSNSSAEHGLKSAAAAPEGPVNSGTEPGSARESSGASGGPTFFGVIVSGARYSPATLAGEVKAQLRAPSSSAALRTASPALRGCVFHFTGGSTPALVDQGSYQGTAAYIIASTSRVWVVGLGCTATKPDLIVSVSLAG